ncbi:MAG: SH3 domain-containing protein [Microgenomates group bacterium]
MTNQKLILPILGLLGLLLLVNLVSLNRLLLANRNVNRLAGETDAIKKTLQEIKDRPTKNDEVTTALANLREELVRYRAEQVGRDQILGLSTSQNDAAATDPYANLSMSLDQALATLEKQLPTSSTTSQIMLNPGWISIDAFEQPKAGSRIVGQLKKDITYTFTTKQTGWYQVTLENQGNVWVQSQFVYETN